MGCFGKLGWWWDGAEGYKDGSGTAARFDSLEGLAIDSTGNVFVCDGDNNVIRKITPNGTTSTFAGQADSYDNKPFDSTAKKSLFNDMRILSIDSQGNLYLSNQELIRKITPQGNVTTIGGKYRNFGRRDGTGDAALFGDPDTTAITVDKDGRVYVADQATVRRGAAVATQAPQVKK